MSEQLVALVVENEAEHIETIKVLLEGHGVEPIVAGTLEAAIAVLETRQFDFVILDLGFPRREGEPDEPKLGYEFLTRLRAKWSREDLYVLVLTGATDRYESIKSTLDLKGNAYVARQDMSDLRNRLLVAIYEAQEWRKRRGYVEDRRLHVKSWKEATILLGNNRRVLAETATGKRREVQPPTDKALETLARLAIANGAEGVDVGLGSGTRSRCSRLSDWVDEHVFCCAGGGRAFITRANRIFAVLRVRQALDPAQRDEWEQKRRPRKPLRPEN